MDLDSTSHKGREKENVKGGLRDVTINYEFQRKDSNVKEMKRKKAIQLRGNLWMQELIFCVRLCFKSIRKRVKKSQSDE